VGYRYCDVSERDCTIVALIGRLKPGRTPQDAQQELNVLARQLEASYPDTNQGVGVVVLPARGAHPGEREENGRTPVLLAAAVGLVLLIACANVAGLLLARTLSRRKEIAVRLALGAGRRRLVRQLLTESLLLSLAGGGAGLMVAFWVKDLLLTYYTVNSEGQRAYFNLDLDLPVLACTLAVSLVTSVVFGLAPAIRASCPDVVPALKDDSWSGPRRSRVRDGLVVAQIAVSLVLLIGAGLLIRSVAGVYRGPGFDSGHVVLLRLRPSLVAQSPEKAKSFQQEVIRRVKALPGIVEASPAFFPPLPGWDGNDIPVWLPGQAPPASRDGYRAAYNFVGPGYFATLGVTLLDGRDFTAADRKGTPAVVIINETLAHHFWPGASAIGRTLVMGEQPCEIIGVVKTVQYRSAADQPRPFVYADFWQYSSIDTEAVDSRTHVRVVGDAAAMLPLIRREIAAVDPDVPISEDRPLTEWLDYTFRPVRAAGTLLGCFSALALLLSAIGLYAVLSSSVSQQTREIAIRMALGAERSDVARLVMRRGASLALVGVASGLVAGLASGTLVRSLLYGVGQTDAVAVSTAAAVLLAAALLACYLPARRAMRVDPMVVLRGE
jgi:putative ABC transport system permease protein